MALVTCPEYSREVSDKAAACPHCGCPLTAALKEAPRELKCPQCGYYNRPDGTKCYQCGAALAAPVTVARPQPQGSAGNVLAAVLSFIIPGLGQLCQGRVGAGVFWFVVAVIAWVVTFGLFGWIVNLIACIEAAAWKGRPSSEGAHNQPTRTTTATQKGRNVALNRLLFVLALVAVIYFVYQRDESSQSSASRSQGPSTVASHRPITAQELARRFDENEVQAEQELAGQRFRVSGRIKDIVTEDLGSSHVVLEGHGHVDVQCAFPWSVSPGTRFHKGQRVSLNCKFSGMNLGNVLVTDCW